MNAMHKIKHEDDNYVITVIMSAVEAASQRVCCERSVTAARETGRRIPQQDLHVLWAALDMEDPLHGFAESFRDVPQSQPSGVELCGHWVSVFLRCFQLVPVNDNNRRHVILLQSINIKFN